jgi:hypothetical protein
MSNYGMPLPPEPSATSGVNYAANMPTPPSKNIDPGFPNKILIEMAIKYYDNPKYPIFKDELKKIEESLKTGYTRAGYFLPDKESMKKLVVANFLGNQAAPSSVGKGGKTYKKRSNKHKTRKGRRV